MDKAVFGCSKDIEVLKVWQALWDVFKVIVLRVVSVEVEVASIGLFSGEEEANSCCTQSQSLG